jgi:pyruvate/2-oxoglutarate dehydrogenase complex dihydrolipoamide acyltransferase (E2) component
VAKLRSPVHVEPREKGWAVVREGNQRATSVHPTQAEAAKEGREIARRDETEFFLHAQDGRIREHSSYGEAQAIEKGEEVTEDAQNLTQQIQEQTLRIAQDFYGESLGRLKGQLQSDRSQLENLAEQVPSEEAQAQIQEMVDSYTAIEESLDQAAQDLGVQDAVNQAVQQAQEAAGQAAQGAQEAAGGAVQQAQGAVGQVAGQAGQLAQGVQDTAGQVAGQAQEAAGQVSQQAQEAAAGGGDQEEEPNATQAARQKAVQLGVDLSQVEGTGSEGRITVKDVRDAASQG